MANKEWLSNEKQKIKASSEPHGHNFEAVAHFKQYADKRGPFYVYSINDRRGNPEKPSLVFKSSALKAQMALKMDRTKSNLLSEEFCYFDGKVQRCKGFVSLTASVYHPLLKKVIPLATMETENENSLSIELFWSYFNDILRKESGLKDYVFNPRGWITDMAGCNIEGLKRVFGPNVVERVKTCEFHFKQCRNRQARKFDEETRKKFKKLSEALLEAQNPTSYEKAKENLDNFIAEEPERMRLTTWLGWWNKRRSFIFPAFQCTKGGPKMNLAEVVHASWVKRDKMNMSLLDAAYSDAHDNVQLEVEFAAFREGNSSGGTGPSVNDLRKRSFTNELRRGQSLGQDLLREDLQDNDFISEQSSSSEQFSAPHDRHNASVTSGPRPTKGARSGRFRPARSKLFVDRLERAKQEKSLIKVKEVNQTYSPRELRLSINTSKCTTYNVFLGNQHSCDCPDFSNHRGKELCKHIIWTMINVCGIPEENVLLQQTSLTPNELTQVLDNVPKDVPENLKFKPNDFPERSRKDIVNNLLANDTRNGRPQIWKLHIKQLKRGPTPRCRGCRAEQREGQPSVSVTGLYVPFEQNFVTETTFYFCPKVACIRRIPVWTNLNPPQTIHDERSVEAELLTDVHFGHIKLVRQ